MKIPETPANVGAYYGNEENGQWQGNGVLVDSGVGGGVVGSGDAGFVHHVPPHYAVRPHLPQPGFVMAGAYYPPPAGYPQPAPPQDDFEDYMWMEDEEAFDKEVMQQLEEEALMEQCIEAMLEDERERTTRPCQVIPNGNGHYPTTSNGVASGANASVSLEEQVSKSTLNPLAAEFVPTGVRATPPASTPAAPVAPVAPLDEKQQPQSEEASPPPPVPPADGRRDVSATRARPDAEADTETAAEAEPQTNVEVVDKEASEKRPNDVKAPVVAQQEAKKPSKPEPRAKAKVVKGEAKVQPKRKEPRAVRSEELNDVKTEENNVAEVTVAVDVVKSQPLLPAEEPVTQTFKPINYAAAAKANKAKKTITTPPSTVPVDKPTTAAHKTEKPIQRKNSAK